jgi:hypothetical protein
MLATRGRSSQKNFPDIPKNFPEYGHVLKPETTGTKPPEKPERPEQE